MPKFSRVVGEIALQGGDCGELVVRFSGSRVPESIGAIPQYIASLLVDRLDSLRETAAAPTPEPVLIPTPEPAAFRRGKK